MLMVHNVASEMHCPLTKELFVDPVLTTAGNTYERKAIVAWFTDHETDPVSGEALESKALIPNNTMKKAVEQVRASKAAAVSGSTSSSIDFERSNSCGASSIASSAMTAATTAAKEELEDMRKKLATFMLGGDMSGGQAGTHAALTLSNAITNLSVGCWGQVAVLEPLPTANLAKWRQQIKWSATPAPPSSPFAPHPPTTLPLRAVRAVPTAVNPPPPTHPPTHPRPPPRPRRYLAPAEQIIVKETRTKVLDDGDEIDVMVDALRSDIARDMPLLSEIDELLQARRAIRRNYGAIMAQFCAIVAQFSAQFSDALRFAPQALFTRFVDLPWEYRKLTAEEQTTTADGKWWKKVPKMTKGSLPASGRASSRASPPSAAASSRSAAW